MHELDMTFVTKKDKLKVYYEKTKYRLQENAQIQYKNLPEDEIEERRKYVQDPDINFIKG